MKKSIVVFWGKIFVLVSAVCLGATALMAGEIGEFEGLIEPSELVKVGTPVAGVVSSVTFKRSSTVTKGDNLVVLESSVENAVVERARVLAAVQGEVRLQEESLAFARRMYTRVEELFGGEVISAEKYDQAATEVTMARARLMKAKENKAIAHLDLLRAQAMLNRRTIKSPISGIVVERYVSPGEFVDNQPLLTVAQMDPLRIEVILPASLFNQIQPGMKADVIPETEKENLFGSTVTIVDRVIDPASGTFGVRLELPNPDYRLPSGLKCVVRFQGVEIDISPLKVENEIAGVSNRKISTQELLLTNEYTITKPR
ncbi:MAG: RND family efflux transporter MFP subunit [Desulforhopalus sp.]|jgi:RND family efflux transporter MFP subunit